MREFQRLAQRDVLGRLRLQILGFQLGQRRVKDVLNIAEALHQFAAARRAQAGRERKGKPINTVGDSC
jgi:hypothetical protein